MEAKKQGAGEEDLSMEEILQSIRRIIADDSEEGKAAAANGANGETPAVASEILELTDMIEDDGSITNLKEAAPDVSKNIGKTVDVLDNIDAALAPEPVAATPVKEEIKTELKPEIIVPKPEQPAAETPKAAAAAQVEKMSDAELEALLSKTAEEAALSSLSKLNVPEEKPVYKATTPSPGFRSGNTVEDMVEEMIRPMLKEWLDSNLPSIVERIVEREVTRLSRR